MLFKFLTGKEIGHLQTGLILSQVGGLLLVFIGLHVRNYCRGRCWRFCLDIGRSWHNPDVGAYSGWQRFKNSVLGSYNPKCSEINRMLPRNDRKQLGIYLVYPRDRFS